MGDYRPLPTHNTHKGFWAEFFLAHRSAPLATMAWGQAAKSLTERYHLRFKQARNFLDSERGVDLAGKIPGGDLAPQRAMEFAAAFQAMDLSRQVADFLESRKPIAKRRSGDYDKLVEHTDYFRALGIPPEKVLHLKRDDIDAQLRAFLDGLKMPAANGQLLLGNLNQEWLNSLAPHARAAAEFLEKHFEPYKEAYLTRRRALMKHERPVAETSEPDVAEKKDTSLRDLVQKAVDEERKTLKGTGKRPALAKILEQLGVSVAGQDISGIDLRGVDCDVDFRGTNLGGADMTNARIAGAIFDKDTVISHATRFDGIKPKDAAEATGFTDCLHAARNNSTLVIKHPAVFKKFMRFMNTIYDYQAHSPGIKKPKPRREHAAAHAPPEEEPPVVAVPAKVTAKKSRKELRKEARARREERVAKAQGRGHGSLTAEQTQAAASALPGELRKILKGDLPARPDPADESAAARSREFDREINEDLRSNHIWRKGDQQRRDAVAAEKGIEPIFIGEPDIDDGQSSLPTQAAKGAGSTSPLKTAADAAIGEVFTRLKKQYPGHEAEIAQALLDALGAEAPKKTRSPPEWMRRGSAPRR